MLAKVTQPTSGRRVPANTRWAGPTRARGFSSPGIPPTGYVLGGDTRDGPVNQACLLFRSRAGSLPLTGARSLRAQGAGA